MKPGQIIEVDSLDDIMAYQPSNSYGLQNMLGSVYGVVGGDPSALSGAEQSAYIHYASSLRNAETEAQKKRRLEQEIKAEEERMEALRQQEERRELNRPKARKCFAGAIVCLATAVFFLSVNFHTEAHDYNTSLLVSMYWFITVVSVGFTFFLCFLGSGYTE